MVTEDIIVKCLAGEAELHELAMVEQWRKADAENEKRYQQLNKLWAHSANIAPRPQLAVDAAWEKVNARMEEKPAGKTIHLRNYWAVAASVALLIGLAIVFFKTPANKVQMLSLNADKGQQELTLTDGSKVILRKGQFEYPGNFNGDKRKVILKKGTAFFDVAPDKTKPFEIVCNQSMVTVLGTEFEITEDDKRTRVLVREGKVRFTTPVREILLTAGMGAEYNKETGVFKSDNSFSSNRFMYATKQLVFNDTRIDKAIEEIEQAYPGRKIVIEGVRTENTVTFTYDVEQGFGRLANIFASTIGADCTMTESGSTAIIRGRLEQ